MPIMLATTMARRICCARSSVVKTRADRVTPHALCVRVYLRDVRAHLSNTRNASCDRSASNQLQRPRCEVDVRQQVVSTRIKPSGADALRRFWCAHSLFENGRDAFVPHLFSATPDSRRLWIRKNVLGATLDSIRDPPWREAR